MPTDPAFLNVIRAVSSKNEGGIERALNDLGRELTPEEVKMKYAAAKAATKKGGRSRRKKTKKRTYRKPV
jgi:hypothetical protein